MSLTDKDFIVFRDLIYEKTGMYFQQNKKYFLESRIDKRMEALNKSAYTDYLRIIAGSGMNLSSEMKLLLNEVTTNETYFFRSPAHLAAFETQMLPAIVAQKGKINFRKLKIWSAASSSGEEAYTLAMVLLEKKNGLLKDWIIEIVGTDISESMIARAQEGIYNDYSVRNVPPQFKSKYFTEKGGRHHLSPEVKRMVTFKHMNLFDDTKMVFMKGFDFIFCANVLIYFDSAAKKKVVQHLYNNLQPYGFLFVGQSESLHCVGADFQPVYFPNGFAYKK